ncbi:MAG: phosphoribosylanthranilate isomerase [Candidatus Amulumruptor caecigallinarius]|nr:phosphoribosylanthranilate isomerase [Candidatus Amulumruptor caecigallinarius]MCM1397279.1 phosphoribosylanthranilate isomerase [Candidatus Amulumruptor caecigallinarius]MCM1453656.1 phosphoribosylanthranilate isomerase [bacterium]
MAPFNPSGHADRMIKVCGMADPRSIRSVSALAPMLMGFIFYPPSPRNACSLDPQAVQALPSFVTPVGVFVNEDADVIASTCTRYGIDTVQLHGEESPELCGELRSRGLYVLKAFGISQDFDWDRLKPYEDVVEMFIFDTSTPSHGGSGQKFDWSLLDSYPLSTPYLLSGGIGPDDIDAVIAAMRPRMAGVDVNSRFETSPGVKNPLSLATFIAKLRNFNENEPTPIPFWKKK